MLKHIVWWTLKDEAEGATGAENGRKMLEMLRGLEGRIPSLRSIDVSMEFLGSTTEPFEKTPTHKIKRYLYVEQ